MDVAKIVNSFSQLDNLSELILGNYSISRWRKFEALRDFEKGEKRYEDSKKELLQSL